MQTMLGPSSEDALIANDTNRGIIQRAFEYIFSSQERQIQEASDSDSIQFLNKVSSYVEIYNEQVFDLLSPENPPCTLREDLKKGGIYVSGATEEVINEPIDAETILESGARNRTTATTAMNRCSSRSHSILTLTIQSKTTKNGITNVKESRINLVDLAGSERQKTSSTDGLRLKEGNHINKSLLTLGKVIDSLVDIAHGKPRHVPYRDSKLTMLLKDSLGGNAKCAMIATVSKAASCLGETLSTLRFASRAKLIKNKARLNQMLETADVIILREEISRLQSELEAFRQGYIPTSKIPTHPFDASLLQSINVRNQLLQQELQSSQKIIDNLNEVFKKKNSQLHHVQMIIRLKEDQISRIKKSEETSDTEKEALKGEIAHLKAMNDQNTSALEYATQVLKLQQELDQLRPIKDHLNEEKQRIIQMEHDWVSKITEIEAIHDSMKIELESYKNGDAYQQMKTLYEAADSELQELRNINIKMGKALESTKQSEDQLKIDLELSLKHIDELESEMNQKAQYFIALQNQLEEANAQNLKIQQIHGTMTDEWKSTEKALNLEIESLQSELQKSKTDAQMLDHYKSLADTYMNEITLLKEANGKLEQKHENLNTENGIQKAKIDDSEIEIKQLKELIFTKDSEIESLKVSLEENNEKLASANTHTELLQGQYDELVKKVNILQQDNHYLQASMREMIASNRDVNMREVERNQEIQTLRRALTSESEMHQKAKQIHEDMLPKYQSALNDLNQKTEELVNLRQQLESSTTVIEEYKSKYSHLEQKYEKVKMDLQMLEDDYDALASKKYTTKKSSKDDYAVLQKLYEDVCIERDNLKTKIDQGEVVKREESRIAELQSRIDELEKKMREKELEQDQLLIDLKQKESQEKAEILERIQDLTITNTALNEDVQKLKSENEKLVQHSNPKQKLQYLVQLKRENNSLKQEVRNLILQIENMNKNDFSDHERPRKQEKLHHHHHEEKENSVDFHPNL